MGVVYCQHYSHFLGLVQKCPKKNYNCLLILSCKYSSVSVSFGGFIKLNKVCFMILDMFLTASPFSRVQKKGVIDSVFSITLYS